VVSGLANFIACLLVLRKQPTASLRYRGAP
jgi:hypothetical protein